jgi:hypothetical protein
MDPLFDSPTMEDGSSALADCSVKTPASTINRSISVQY